MLNMINNDVVNENNKRKRPNDQKREVKIQHFTEQLKSKKITPGLFLEAMANKDMLPEAGIYIWHLTSS